MQRTGDLTTNLLAPRTIDPSLPDDRGAGGIPTPEGEAGEAEEPRDDDDDDDSNDETEIIEVGDPRDGP